MVVSRKAGRTAAAASRAAFALLTLSTTSLPAAADAGSSALEIDGTSRPGSGSYPHTSTPTAARSIASLLPASPSPRSATRPALVPCCSPSCCTATLFIGSSCPRNLSQSKTELLTIFATFRQYASQPCLPTPITTPSGARSSAVTSPPTPALSRRTAAPRSRCLSVPFGAPPPAPGLGGGASGWRLGMARGAVRPALTRLEEEGLVVREPHRGARVRK